MVCYNAKSEHKECRNSNFMFQSSLFIFIKEQSSDKKEVNYEGNQAYAKAI